MPATWTTRDGCELFISKMGTEHIANTIAMIHRNAGRRVARPKYGYSDAKVHQVLRLYHAKYRALVRELNRRAMRALANVLVVFLDGTVVRGMQLELD